MEPIRIWKLSVEIDYSFLVQHYCRNYHLSKNNLPARHLNIYL